MTTYRQLTHDDLAAAARLSSAVGWPHRVDDWRLALDLGRGIAAFENDRLIGAAMTWHWGDTVATLGMVVVDPAMQGGGIGRTLVGMALDAVAGHTVALNATTAALPLYRSLGFVESGRVLQCEGVAPTGGVEPSGSGVRTVAAQAEHLPALQRLDRQATGVDRRAMLTAFHTIGHCLVATTEEGILGFACRRPFGRGSVIGPVIAGDADIALGLIRTCIQENGGSRIRIDVPDSSGLAERLSGWGLEPVGTVVRMIRGADDPRRTEAPCVYALASHAFD